MERLGVVDLGSNSVRLVVYEVRDDLGKRISKKDFSTLVDMKKMAGLSAYVKDGVFTDQGIEKAAYILTRHRQRAHNVGCDNVSIFATAVLRNCKNSKSALSAIEKAVGQKVRLLSGEEEAHLDLVGARCEHDIVEGTLVDIGGGSTELLQVRKGKEAQRVSLDQGSISSYAQFVQMVLPTAQEREAIASSLAERVQGLPDAGAYRNDVLYGVGGSIRAVAKMKGILEEALKVPKRLERGDVERLMGFLEDDPAGFAHAAAKAVPDRLHTIGCGLVMVQLLMELFAAERIEVCRYGVREGFLIEHVLRKAPRT